MNCNTTHYRANSSSVPGDPTLARCSTPTRPPTDNTGSNDLPPAGGSSTSADGGAPPPAAVCRFAPSPTPFALPTLGLAPASPFTQLSNQEACPAGTGKLVYSLADMNADGQVDLVVTADCDDATVGTSAWLVYLNDGNGFAAAPVRFALPPPTPTAGCATSVVFDINGDYIPDEVVTALCNDTTVGTSRWLVYPGGASGFAQTAVPYALPPGYTAGAFTATTAATESCAGGADVPAFSLFDINGDALVDFVMTAVCNEAAIGSTAWQVYAGSASGASQTAASFALPTSPVVTPGAFLTTTGALSCTSTTTRPAYSLLDFDEDGKIDLVVTQECTDATIGTSRWHWYPNGGQGFAASPTAIALPSIPGAPTGSFVSLSSVGQCANGAGSPTYALADVNGDRVLDLLVTRDCADVGTGVTYWRVYPNAGAGFTTTARLLTLPAAIGATIAAPAGLSGTLSCGPPAVPAYTTTFLAGRSLDLVVTAECADSTVGATRWMVLAATCD